MPERNISGVGLQASRRGRERGWEGGWGGGPAGVLGQFPSGSSSVCFLVPNKSIACSGPSHLRLGEVEGSGLMWDPRLRAQEGRCGSGCTQDSVYLREEGHVAKW